MTQPAVTIGGGRGTPRLTFCCELPTDRLEALLDDPSIIDDLVALGAAVSLATLDLTAERAALVRRLNGAGVPMTAWLVLAEADGYYCTPDNAAAAAARYEAFKAWVGEHDLRFVGVALDVEPAIQELRGLATEERGSVVRLWLRRLLDGERVRRGVSAYRELLAQIRADGFRTESYQFGFVVEEREAGGTLLQRGFGSMDLRVDREWLMLYSSFLKDAAAGFLWNYAGGRSLPVVGDTGGIGTILPLSWEQLRRDLLLARRWGEDIGVFSLEGSVAQGFLPRLRAFRWDDAVERPPAAGPLRVGLGAMRLLLTAIAYPRVAVAIVLLLRRLLRHPRFAAGWLAAALADQRFIRPRLRTWGSSRDEAWRPLAGDRVVPRPRLQHTRATTIHAPVSAVWPWLVQMGFRRGGYYYPGAADALWDVLIRRRFRGAPWYTDESVVNRNADRIVPELQDLEVGDRIQDGPDGYFEVREVLPLQALVLYTARHPLTGRPVDPADPRTEAFVEGSWSFVLEPVDDRTNRLIVRLRGTHSAGPAGRAAMYMVFEPVDWLMQTVMLAGIRERAERAAAR